MRRKQTAFDGGAALSSTGPPPPLHIGRAADEIPCLGLRGLLEDNALGRLFVEILRPIEQASCLAPQSFSSLRQTRMLLVLVF